MPEDAPRHAARLTRPFTPTLALAAIAVLVALGARVLGPSDLHQNQDQTKTIAFTMDAALNANWALPRDGSGEPSHKPPLVNWIGAPFVLAGWHTELALKMPSLLSGLVIAGVTFLAARRLFARLDRPDADAGDRMLAANALPGAVAAAAVWVACPSSIKHIYFLRPDIVMAACLAVAWACATVLMADPAPRRRWAWALTLWTAAGLAALAKGPMALLVPAYLLILALVRAPGQSGGAHTETRLQRVMRTGWWWGVPVLFAIPLLWLYAAWRADPSHVEDTLIGFELGTRVAGPAEGSRLDKMAFALRNVPVLFLARFAPWAVPCILAMAFKPSNKWISHPMGPAAIWVALVLVVNALVAGNAASFLIPAYPAAAILAVYASARLIAGANAARARLAFPAITAIAIVVACAVGAHEAFNSRAARTGEGDAIKRFARDAQRLVGDDPVAFVGVGDNPVSSLMGRHHAGDPTPEALARAAWVVSTIDEDAEVTGPPPAAISAPVAPPVAILEARSERRVRLRLDRAPPPIAPEPPG